MRVSARRGVLRGTSASVVISRAVGIAIIVAPVAIKVTSHQTDCTKECCVRVGVVIPSPCVTIVARAIMITLS